MIDKDLSRNASGYYDPTAYEAMQNYEKERRTMNQGEIWEIKMNNGQYREVIVIVVNDDIATILQLNDVANGHSITVNCQGIKYTDPRKIQYAFNDTFVSFIRSLKTDEFEKIMDAVADCLGLVIHTEHTEEAVEPVNLEKLAKTAEFVPLPEPSIDLFDIEKIMDVERAKAERDVYKGLYEQLLDKIKKVG